MAFHVDERRGGELEAPGDPELCSKPRVDAGDPGLMYSAWLVPLNGRCAGCRQKACYAFQADSGKWGIK